MQKWDYKYLIRSRAWDATKTTAYNWGAGWKVFYEDTDQLPDSITLLERAKQLGEQGWELVAVIPFSSVLGADRYGTDGYVALDFAGFTTEEKWIFKRPKG